MADKQRKYKLRKGLHWKSLPTKKKKEKKRNLEDKDKTHSGTCAKKDPSKKMVLFKRQNTTDNTGEPIMERYEEQGQPKLRTWRSRVRGLCELTAVWLMNGKREWQEHWVQIRYWLSSYWISKLWLVVRNTRSTLQSAILAGKKTHFQHKGVSLKQKVKKR